MYHHQANGQTNVSGNHDVTTITRDEINPGKYFRKRIRIDKIPGSAMKQEGGCSDARIVNTCEQISITRTAASSTLPPCMTVYEQGTTSQLYYHPFWEVSNTASSTLNIPPDGLYNYIGQTKHDPQNCRKIDGSPTE